MTCLKNVQPLSLEHQSILNGLWQPLCLENDLQFAEYSFANAYLFRRQHNYQFIDCDPPLVRGEFHPGKYYYIPTCQPKDCYNEAIKKIVNSQVTLFPIPEMWISDFESLHPLMKSCRQDSDYLYRAEKLKTLSGRALSSRRNLLHQFEAQHVVESKELTPDVVADAIKVLDEWQSHSGEPKEKTDYFSCMDALYNLEPLKLKGRIVYAEGLPVGFIIGEMLTPKTALFHLSKSLHSYKGVTPFLYQDFANRQQASVEWINLEQDLGIPALRQAKEAYEPDLLLPKFRLTI